MREIKFRVWSTKDKKFVCYDYKLGVEYNENEFQNCIYQQYTGLNDSEDKEIYEGDLLELEPAYEGMPLEYDFVKWNDGAWRVHGGYLSDFTNCKVVGNKCETWYVCTYGGAVLDSREIKELRF